jgi:hypothetical protein
MIKVFTHCKFPEAAVLLGNFCDPVGTRTQDPIIKSDVLYQLSYEIIPLFKTERGAKIIIIIF